MALVAILMGAIWLLSSSPPEPPPLPEPNAYDVLVQTGAALPGVPDPN